MSRLNDYRRTMHALRPSPDWRTRTLAAMEAAQAERAPAPRRPAPRWALAAVCILLCAGAFCAALWLGIWAGLPVSALPAPSQQPGQPERREDVYTFLLAAASPSSDLTDCIMAATYDSRAQTVRLLSLPRDTRVDAVDATDGTPLSKLNTVYAANGAEALRAQAAALLGYPIDFYMILEPQGFVELVDAVGGVEFDVPMDMDYDDPLQNIHIHLDAGLQVLDGEEALGVALCRRSTDAQGRILPDSGYPDGDLGRTAAQRALLAAVMEQALSQPRRLPDYVALFLEHVETDLTAAELLALARQAAGLEFPDGVSGFLLPGTVDGEGHYYVPDEEAVRALINAEELHPYTGDLPVSTPSGPDGTAEAPLPDGLWSLPDAAYWLGSSFSMTYFFPNHNVDPDAGRYLDAFSSLPVYENRTAGLDDARPIGRRVAGVLGTTVVSDSWDEGEGCGRYQAVLADGSELTLQGRTGLRVELASGVDEGTIQKALDALNSPAGESALETEFLSWALGGASYAADLSSCSCTVIPDEYTRYSIRTEEEAVALFRSGDYWGSMNTAYPERAEILEVRLIYLTEPYMEQLQPVYAIYFTQDYWEVYEDARIANSSWVDESYLELTTQSVPSGVAYVPAVEGLSFQYRSAEGRDLHRTPAVTDVWSLPDAQGRDWMFYIRGEHVPNPTEQVYVSAFTELPAYYNRLTSEADGLAIARRAASLLGTSVSSGAWDDDEGYGRYRAELADGSELTLLGRTTLNYTPGPGVDGEAAREALAALNTPVGDSGLEQGFLESALGGSLSSTSCLVLPEEAARYRIRSWEEAVALFRSGDYWGGVHTAYPERAEILDVRLEYAARPYLDYVQPVYAILYTQDYWKEYQAAWFPDDPDFLENCTPADTAYVPAVEGLNFQLYPGEGESLHRTLS